MRAVGALMFPCAAGGFGIWAAGLTEFAVVAACLGGIVFGAEFDFLGVMIRRHLGWQVFGRVYGIQFAGFQLGNAVGAAGLAYVLSQQGRFTAGLEAIVLLSLVGAALFLTLGKDPVAPAPA